MFTLQYILISLPVILVTITIHEFAHAKVADMLGDPTPRYAGRLTLNPISHIDPIGFLMLFLFRFGWAKPVPVNPNNFADPRAGSAYVSLAGPLSNFFTAWVIAIILKNAPIGALDFQATMLITNILAFAIWINIALGVFNLIPIPPLDGSHILEAVLPYEQAAALRNMGSYSFLLLILLLVFPGTRLLLISVIEFIFNFMLR
jgi:Zn-dependent protease